MCKVLPWEKIPVAEGLFNREEKTEKKQWLDSEARYSTSKQADIFNNEGD